MECYSEMIIFIPTIKNHGTNRVGARIGATDFYPHASTGDVSGLEKLPICWSQAESTSWSMRDFGDLTRQQET